MATDVAWQTVGTIASTAGLTGFAFTGVQGAIAGYQAFVSPYASLTKSESKLKMVKSRLQELSPQRRKEIEIAARSGSFEFTSLEHFEKKLAQCVLLIEYCLTFVFVVSWTCTGDRVSGVSRRHLWKTIVRSQIFGVAF
jgi:hypothetical protein